MSGHNNRQNSIKSLKNQRGSTAVDYAVIVFGIVLAVIVVVKALESKSVVIFNATTETVKDFERVR